MKNNIVFTQDVAGEREWLHQRFPGCHMFETEFGGRWPEEPFVQNFDGVWEIPPDSHKVLNNVSGTIYKSMYQLDTNFASPRWCDADRLLINNFDFVPQSRSSKAQVIHFARSGTVFLESILYTHCRYKKDRMWNPADRWADHYWMTSNDTEFYKIIQHSLPDMFFVYRKNWWQWLVSLQISMHHGYHHHFNNIDWNSLEPFEITAASVDNTVSMVKAAWNGLCHFRTQFPNLNFYIVEFSDLIKNQHLTAHQSIAYDKKRLVKNYNEAQQWFESDYCDKFDLCARRCLDHLQVMGCQTIQNFDHLIG